MSTKKYVLKTDKNKSVEVPKDIYSRVKAYADELISEELKDLASIKDVQLLYCDPYDVQLHSMKLFEQKENTVLYDHIFLRLAMIVHSWQPDCDHDLQNTMKSIHKQAIVQIDLQLQMN